MEKDLLSRTGRQNGSGPGWRIGADIGGTFTDVILLSPAGEVTAVKVLSTPPDFAAGVLSASLAALAQAGAAPHDVRLLLHGTTVATNAILERTGARTGLVTTAGFRDVLEIGRLRRPRLYDLSWVKPAPLARRRNRYELNQRITADGQLAPAADGGEVAAIAGQLRAAGIEAVAVCLVNSYRRPDEERRVADLLRQALPGTYISASVDISPELQEFERTSTAVVNSYIGPVVRGYMDDLRQQLSASGLHAPCLVMQSSGGLMAAPAVSELPVQIIESGPAAGVTAASRLARAIGLDNVVAFDMGGTTAKASLIENGEPFVAAEYEVGGGMNLMRGLGRGAGYPIRVPSLDIAEVGAGGGSIISVDAAGALHVGPDSAGARPGPACYGNGGDRPTITDANVALGYLSPLALAGGRVSIEPKLADEVLREVAGVLGTDAQTVARGAYEIAVSSMTKAVKAVTSERGRDPREAVLIAFGGAGPLYGAQLARELGISTVLVPVRPGLFSSLGLLVADIERQHVTPCGGDTGLEAVRDGIVRMEEAVRADLAGASELSAAVEIEHLLDMRYRGQRFELRVALPDGPVSEEALALARNHFHAEHRRTYGRAAADELVEIVNIRVRGRIVNDLEVTGALAIDEDFRLAAPTRLCHFDQSLETPVITRSGLGPEPLPGPLIVEDMDSTTLVPPGARAHRDQLNNIVIEWPRQEAA
jgi:N-methylhydantoinase A